MDKKAEYWDWSKPRSVLHVNCTNKSEQHITNDETLIQPNIKGPWEAKILLGSRVKKNTKE